MRQAWGRAGRTGTHVAAKSEALPQSLEDGVAQCISEVQKAVSKAGLGVTWTQLLGRPGSSQPHLLCQLSALRWNGPTIVCPIPVAIKLWPPPPVASQLLPGQGPTFGTASSAPAPQRVDTEKQEARSSQQRGSCSFSCSFFLEGRPRHRAFPRSPACWELVKPWSAPEHTVCISAPHPHLTALVPYLWLPRSLTSQYSSNLAMDCFPDHPVETSGILVQGKVLAQALSM